MHRTLAAISRWKELINKMKYLTRWTFILIVVSCGNKDNKIEILRAKFSNKGISTTNCLIRLYSDSTYIFDVHEYQEYQHEKNEIFRGRYYLTGDSVVFSPFDFDYLNAETARIKDNYLEFLDGKRPFKMKVVYGKTNNKTDTLKFKDYSFFANHTIINHVFPKDVISYDLTNADLNKVDSLLKLCIKDVKIKRELTDYFKQCIAVKNKNNEREVWINMLCKPKDFDEMNYFIIEVHDGGDCYFNVKLNLDKGEYYELIVNGDA